MINLIFEPGFSTKEEVTDISGRGVGMDALKTEIDKLHGEVKVMTEIGQGTTFEITIPNQNEATQKNSNKIFHYS